MLSPEAKAKLLAYANPQKTPPADPSREPKGGEEEGEDPAEFRFVDSDQMVMGDGEEDEEDGEDEESELPPEEPMPDDYDTVGAEKFNARRREEGEVRRPRPDMREMMRKAAGEVKRG